MDAIDAVLSWLKSVNRSEGVVVDAGANVGTTSIPLAQAGFRVLGHQQPEYSTC